VSNLVRLVGLLLEIDKFEASLEFARPNGTYLRAPLLPVNIASAYSSLPCALASVRVTIIILELFAWGSQAVHHGKVRRMEIWLKTITM